MTVSAYECLYGRDIDSPTAIEKQNTLVHSDLYIQRVLRAYGTDVVLSPERTAASLEARNEAVFWQGELGRSWVRRIYVFGRKADPYSESPFWGFFHLRNENALHTLQQKYQGTVPTVAECYLKLPPRLRHAGYQVIAGPFTTYYGVLPVDVTPMVFPHHFFAGHCAHSAVHTTLVLMSSRGARPLGLFDLSLILANAKERPNVPIPVRGLRPQEITRLLQSEETGISALDDEYEWSPESLEGLLLDCVRSGLPLIVAVDFKTWVRQVKKYQDVPVPDPIPQEKPCHAIVLVGGRECNEAGKPKFLFHDSNLGPWIEIDTAGVAAATTAYAPKQDVSCSCRVVLPVPRGVTVAPRRVSEAVCNLLKNDARRSCPHCNPSHLRRTLLSRTEFLTIYEPQLRRRNQISLTRSLNTNYPDLQYVWRVLHKGQPRTVFIIDASSPDGANMVATIFDDKVFWLSDPFANQGIEKWTVSRADHT